MTKRNKETEIQEVQAGTLGNLLQQYRESVGYSVTQTADALCLSEATIIKLENEAFDTLAEPPYIRGYLRNYAKLAEKDPGMLIDAYESLRGAPPDELKHHFKPVAPFRRKPLLFPMLAKIAVLVLVIAGLAATSMIPEVRTWFADTWNSFSQQTSAQVNGNIESNNNPLLTGNMPAPLPIPIEQGGPESDTQDKTDNAPNKPASDKKLAQDSTQVKNQATGKQQAASDQAAAHKTEENKQAASVNDSSNENQADTGPVVNTVKIRLVFNQEVWLRIKDKDKKTVYEGQSSAGNEKQLELEKPLTFRVGNAQGVSIFVDGKSKDITEYIRGSVANFTLQ